MKGPYTAGWYLTISDSTNSLPKSCSSARILYDRTWQFYQDSSTIVNVLY